MDLEKKLLVTKKIKLHEMEKGKKKKTHKIVIHLYTPVQIVGQKQKNTEKEVLVLFPSGRSDLGWCHIPGA